MEIIEKKINALRPYQNNQKIHTEKQIQQIANSINEFGFKQPLVITKDNEIIIGHGRLEAAKILGMAEVPCIVADDLSEAQIKALRIADNKLNMDTGFDEDLLQLELKELEGLEFDFSDIMDFEVDEVDEIEEFKNNLSGDDERYTQKTESPNYEPTGDKPSINELYDIEKTHKLIEKIESSSVDKEIKDFLIIAAHRHIVFDYEKIAEFYAHADKEIQELIEDSYLVIVDFDRVIADGYIKMDEEFDRIQEDENNA